MSFLPSPLWIKICGITQPNQARAIAELGATALGFICTSRSPRYVTPEQIRAIVATLPKGSDVERIGVFVDATLGQIQQTVELGKLSGVQLHGAELPEFCDRLRQVLPEIKIIRALRIRTSADLAQEALYSGKVDALLLDAYHPKLQGGTGETLDWQALRQFQPSCSWFLAGGLTPDNVLEALSQVQPNGIDLSSGVEDAPGDKNLDKVTKLFSTLMLTN
jgi:phosphoribosylanthranilate isomerase